MCIRDRMVAGLITTFGTVAIAANAVGNSVMTMSQMPGAAVSLAMVTVVALAACQDTGKLAHAVGVRANELYPDFLALEGLVVNSKHVPLHWLFQYWMKPL